MMRWLLDEAKHSVVELRGSTVLLYYLLFTDPRDLDWFLDRAIGFRNHIPRMVLSGYQSPTHRLGLDSN